MENIDTLQEQYNSLKEQYECLSEQVSNVYLEMNACACKINKCKRDSFEELNRSKIGKYYYHADYDNEENIVTHRYIFIKDVGKSHGSNYFLVDLIEWKVVNRDICDFQYIKEYSIYVNEDLKDYIETTDKEFNDFLAYCHARNC